MKKLERNSFKIWTDVKEYSRFFNLRSFFKWLDPDPNIKYESGSKRANNIQIRQDPDLQHWFYPQSKLKTLYFTRHAHISYPFLPRRKAAGMETFRSVVSSTMDMNSSSFSPSCKCPNKSIKQPETEYRYRYLLAVSRLEEMINFLRISKPLALDKGAA